MRKELSYGDINSVVALSKLTKEIDYEKSYGVSKLLKLSI